MIEAVNSLSVEGWLTMLKSLLPSGPALFVWDVVLFVVLPLAMVMILLRFFKSRFNPGAKGVWRTAGEIWSKCFWISLLAMVGVYFMAHSLLVTEISGITSFATDYRASMPGYEHGKKDFWNIKAISERCQNQRATKEGQGAKGREEDVTKRPAYKVTAFFYRHYGYIHPTIPTLLGMIALAWFFWPGFKMKRQMTKV